MSYVRASIKGTMLTAEQWSINPTFDPTFEFPGDVNQTALDAACQAIADLAVPTGLRAIMGAQTFRSSAQLEVRDDGTDALIAISTAVSAVVVAGTSAAFLPPQSALVLSLRTDVPGGSGRGRLYWPALTATVLGTGRIDATEQANFLADFKTYLTGMQSALATAFPTIGFDLAVRSKTTHSTPHVTRLQAGNLVDTQRRRRDALPESYLSVAY